MKKLYFLLLGLFALCGMNTAQAKLVVTDTTEWMSDLSEIKQNDSLMFYCYAREGWLYNNWKADNPSPQLNLTFTINSSDSRSYVWVINSLTDKGDGTFGITLKTLSEPAKYMKGFSAKGEWSATNWGYWSSDDMFTTEEGEATEFIISKVTTEDLASVNDGTFSDEDLDETTTHFVYITDTNIEPQCRFNGQNDDNGDGIANFVGWPSGLNCCYKFKRAHLTNYPTCNVTLQPVNQNGDDILDGSTTSDELLAGDTVKAPTYENYVYVSAEGENGEVTLPYEVTQEDVENGELYFTLTYEKYPELTFNVIGEDGNALTAEDGSQLVASFAQYYEPGTQFTVPTINALKLGYEFVSAVGQNDGTNYIGHEISTADDGDIIDLTYRVNSTAGLPFVPTTIENGAFAAGTKYYQMTVRGGYVYTNPAAAEALGGDYAKVANAAALNTDSIENSVWAFVGNLDDGFEIYNYAEGATKKLFVVSNEDGTAAQLATEDEIAEINVDGTGSYTFNLSANSNGGYNFSYRDADNTASVACLNRFGGTNGTDLKFWNNDASPSDAGSNFLFYEADFDSLTTVKFTTAQTYLAAEGAVSGWTADQLSTLKAAVAAKDIDAANAAIAVLQASTDTIAFDINKTYKLTAAYKGFISAQPGATYAMYASGDSVKWGAASDADTYQWIFATTDNDSTYYVSNLANQRTIASYRFNSQAVFYNGTIAADTASNITTQVGDRAPIMLVKSTVVPGAYRLVHPYGPSTVTLCIKQGTGGDELTGGAIATYNGDIADRGNTWHLVPVGDVPTGIDAAVITPAGSQNSVIYDLSGRRVNNAQRGIYIVNGKKVLVK